MRLGFGLASFALSACLASLTSACGGTGVVTIPDPDGGSGLDGTLRDTSAPDEGADHHKSKAPDGGGDDGPGEEAGPESGGPDAQPDGVAPDAGGCTGASDCPVGEACDLGTGACTKKCSASQACNGACCAATGECAPGNTAGACGAAGTMCAVCVGNSAGTVCEPTGTCGCTESTDCPGEEACDTFGGGTCTTSCNVFQTCNEGCCSMAGRCVAGTSPSACGAAGTSCTSCVGSSSGDQCLSTGACGCSTSADCPTYEACDVKTGACTNACSAAQTCNGGCCSAAAGGTCQEGNSTTACGDGKICLNCKTTCPPGDTCTCGGSAGCTH